MKKAIKDIEAPNAAAALKALVGVLDSFKKAVTKELQDSAISAGICAPLCAAAIASADKVFQEKSICLVQTLTQGNASACKAFHHAGVTQLCLVLLDKGSDPSKSFAVKTLGNLCCDRDACAAVSCMDSLPPLVSSLCRAKDPDVQIGACQCIALVACDAPTAAAYVAAGAAAAVCAILKSSAQEPVTLAAAMAAAALTTVAAGAVQVVEGGGVQALKKAAALGDGVKVHSLRSLHQCVQHSPEAAVQAREVQWLPLLLELLQAKPAVASEAAMACARLAGDATNRQALAELHAPRSICSSLLEPAASCERSIPLLLAAAALAHDSSDNAQFFVDQGALPAIVTCATLSAQPALQQAFCRAIAAIVCASEPRASAAAACGALQAIVAALADPSQTPESLTCACVALGSMCEVARKCSDRVLALAGVQPLVVLLAAAQEEVRCAACSALLQLVRYCDDEVDREVLRAGAAGYVLHMMRRGSRAEVTVARPAAQHLNLGLQLGLAP